MILRIVPLLTGILPIVAINVCYVIAVQAEHVAYCIPYLEGCTSVSSTGRSPPQSYVFKAVMLPNAIMLMVYWVLCVAWLRSLDKAAGRDAGSGMAIGILGVISAVCLILYVTFLGTEEPFYRFMRRFGVYVYFAFSVFAQLILAIKVLPFALDRKDNVLLGITKVQLVLAIVPFLLGALNLLLKETLENSDPAENMIEWNYSLLMQLYFVLTYFSWKQTGFTADFAVSGTSNRY